MPPNDQKPGENLGTISHMWDSMLDLFRDLAGGDDLHGPEALILRAFVSLLVIGGFFLALIVILKPPDSFLYLAGGMFCLLFIAFALLMITQMLRPPGDRRLAAAQRARADAIAAEPIT